MSSPAEFRALALGRFARRVLAQGRPAKVIASFERSVYVANRAGVACLGSGLGHGPLNVQLSGTRQLPAMGCAVTVDTQDARTWRPPALRGISMPRAVLRIERGMFASAHAGADALRQWIASGARGHAPREAASLIGLGPGLTPAGDDLVGGALVALHALGRRACAARVAAWALRRSRRTNRISRAHLACAAAGAGGAALHDFVNALLAGKRNVARELAALDAIGHTSGWDAAAGVLLALEALRPGRIPPARSQVRASRRGTRAGVRPA
jgi:hypothetical protein